MNKFQKKIDSLTDTEFVKKYVIKRHDNIKASEKRHLYKKTKSIYGSKTDLYYVVFEYTLIKDPGVFKTNAEVATRIVKDHVLLKNDADDADKYMNNVLYPVEVTYIDPSGEFMFDMYIKGYDSFIIKGEWHLNHSLALHAYDKKNINGNSVAYGYSYKGLIMNLDEYISSKDIYTSQMKGSELVKTICVNNIVNITDDKIANIKESLAETKDLQKALVIAEIERTKEYLEVLNKLL